MGKSLHGELDPTFLEKPAAAEVEQSIVVPAVSTALPGTVSSGLVLADFRFSRGGAARRVHD
jgi:hypothetical protein